MIAMRTTRSVKCGIDWCLPLNQRAAYDIVRRAELQLRVPALRIFSHHVGAEADDAIRRSRQRMPMGDDDRRAAPHRAHVSVEHVARRFRVARGTRLTAAAAARLAGHPPPPTGALALPA